MIKKITFIFVALISIYVVWCLTDLANSNFVMKPKTAILEYGNQQKTKNLLGFQIEISPSVYTSKEVFEDFLNQYFEEAKSKNLITDSTVVILPEYIGTWLLLEGEKNSIFIEKSAEKALQTLVLSNPIDFTLTLLKAPEQIEDKIKYSVFAMKSQKIASIYQEVFQHLAKKHKVGIVAGSILLQNPTIESGKIKTNDGGLFNASFYFHPDGQIDKNIVRKQFVTEDEKVFLSSNKSKNQDFKTKIGKLKVMICADSWFEESYQETLKNTYIAVPTYSSGFDSWNKPWQGYSNAPTPADAKEAVGKINLNEAWQQFAMAGRAPKVGINQGLNVFLAGKLWDLGIDGSSIILDSKTIDSKIVNKSAIISLWL